MHRISEKKVANRNALIASSCATTRLAVIITTVIGLLLSTVIAIRLVAQAVDEQATNVQQVSRAVADIDQSVQGTAARAEELASGSERLTTENAELLATVSELATLAKGR